MKTFKIHDFLSKIIVLHIKAKNEYLPYEMRSKIFQFSNRIVGFQKQKLN